MCGIIYNDRNFKLKIDRHDMVIQRKYLILCLMVVGFVLYDFVIALLYVRKSLSIFLS